MKPAIPKPQRCAIYTRKSTEHNLDLAAQRDKVGVQVLRGPLLLARFACFLPQSTHQLLGKWVQFAWPIGNLELWLHRVRPQVFADRVP